MQNINYSRDLSEKSLAAMLAAIEIYNKPNFSYREELFSILVINSWELLLKAKILSDNNNRIEALYVQDKEGNLKRNRNGVPLTIEILRATKLLNLEGLLVKNLSAIIELRDVSMHFYNKKPFSYLIYILGVANLKNYQKLIKKWFKKDLLEYNFHIMPLGFFHSFDSYSMLDLKKEPEIIQSILAKISEEQTAKSENGFYFSCEIKVNLVSAKKITDATDLVVKVDPTETQTIAIIQNKKLIERYRYTYTELYKKVKEKISGLKQSEFNTFIKGNKIKSNTKYSAYHFRSAKQQQEYKKRGTLPNSITSLYNENCFRFMLNELPKIVEQRREKEKKNWEELKRLSKLSQNSD